MRRCESHSTSNISLNCELSNIQTELRGLLLEPYDKAFQSAGAPQYLRSRNSAAMRSVCSDTQRIEPKERPYIRLPEDCACAMNEDAGYQRTLAAACTVAE